MLMPLHHLLGRSSSRAKVGLLAVSLVLGTLLGFTASAHAVLQQTSGSTGVEGVIPSSAPTQAPTISLPSNGQNFSNLPITVSGLCPKGLLVEVFKNGVFSGSAECTNGSYSVVVDLFNGQNDLIARAYDALNQASPDSNKVTVTFNSGLSATGPRPTLTTNYAKRGADPGSVLTWPLTLSGGTPPYAISVDWGDKSPLDLISRNAPGDFNIEHTYTQSGVFNITIKVTDSNGSAAFLQLVGISNGPIQQTNKTNQGSTVVRTEKVFIWWPLLIGFALTIVAFWLGKQHQLQTIRDRLRRGERPF